jgi:hypothetical protein
VRDLTGDTLTIAIFVWGAAIAFLVAGLQAIQGKQGKWAAIYFSLCAAAIALGICVPSVATFVKSNIFQIYADRSVEAPSQKTILLSDYFSIPAFITACLYSGVKTYFRRRSGKKFNLHLSLAYVAHGFTLVPAVILCLALRNIGLATYVIQNNPGAFCLCGMFIIVNVLQIPSPDITEEDLA